MVSSHPEPQTQPSPEGPGSEGPGTEGPGPEGPGSAVPVLVQRSSEDI